MSLSKLQFEPLVGQPVRFRLADWGEEAPGLVIEVVGDLYRVRCRALDATFEMTREHILGPIEEHVYLVEWGAMPGSDGVVVAAIRDWDAIPAWIEANYTMPRRPDLEGEKEYYYESTHGGQWVRCKKRCILL